MKSETAFAMACLIIMLAGPASSQRPNRTRLGPDEVQKCLADHGRVTAMGLLGNEGCIRPMPDAGKRCTDRAQCKARCLLDQSKPGFRWPKDGERAEGVCAATDSPFGCAAEIDKGRISSAMCVD